MEKTELTTEQQVEFDNLIIKAMVYAFLVQRHTDYCVFIDYSGHVDSLDIRIRASKKNWQEEVCGAEISTKLLQYWDGGDIFASLKSRVDILKEILDTNDIPYGDMDYEVEQIKKHYF